MKIAVTSRDQQAVTGPACDCHGFLLYETMDGKITGKNFICLTKSEVLANFKGKLSGQPNHPLTGIECLITSSLGEGLNKRLKDDGIKTIATNTQDPDGAVVSILKYI